jgi:RNA polymerase sigma-70 factor (ECF subfamily)
MDDYDGFNINQDSPEQEYIRDSKKVLVNKVLNKLKPEYRQVLWLHYFEDMQYKEIAIIMNKSVHATQMLACRAKEALKNELIKEGVTDETY